MARTATPLKKKYGKLTVVGEESVKGRRRAIVNCTCGRQKRVYVDALTSGRTRSCGARTCRYGSKKLAVDRKFQPRGSKVVPLTMLRKIVAATSRQRNPITVSEAARLHGIESVQTLHSVLRAVRKCGGIDEYARRVR